MMSCGKMTLLKLISIVSLPHDAPLVMKGDHTANGLKCKFATKPGTAIAIRKVKYLNNIVEQDHRGVKRVTRPMLGFKAFGTAQDTLVGIELMHMIRKKQMVVEAGEEGRTAAEQFYSLAA